MTGIIIAVFLIVIVYLTTRANGVQIPEVPRWIEKISKVMAVLSLIIVITMIADLVLPLDSFEVEVQKEVDSQEVSFGIYKEALTDRAYEQLSNGDRVIIKVSKIYDEIKAIKVPDSNKVISFPTVDNYAFPVVVIFFSLPVLVYIKRVRKYKMTYFISTISGPVLGVISLILIVELFLVHVFHTMARM